MTANISEDHLLPMGNCSVTLANGEKIRLTVHSFALKPRGKYRVRLEVEGPGGRVVVNLPRRTFWTLT